MRLLLYGLAAAIKSLLSDEPKSLSLKRWISMAFALCILYMSWHFLRYGIRQDCKETFEHVINVMCLMIGLLTGAATVKDIIALRFGITDNTSTNGQKPTQQQ